MVEKIAISNIAVIIYTTFVVSTSLLAGILPVYVNRPVCESISNQANTVKNDFVSPVFEHKPLTERQLKIRQQLNEYKDEKLGTTYDSIGNISYCPELINPQPMNYPWYDFRLPTNVIPLHYDLYFNLPLWTTRPSIYNGAVGISVNVTVPTNYIILHVEVTGIPIFINLTDSSGNLVEIDCNGEFTFYNYYILKTKNKLTLENGPYYLRIAFLAALSEFESGLFEFNFASAADPTKKDLTMLASRFEPLDARRAFPCFDEPQLKATYNITITHPAGTIALLNTPSFSDSSLPNLTISVNTRFEMTPMLPSSLIGVAVFYEKDFKSIDAKTKSGIPVRVWARNHFVDEGQVDAALDMVVGLFDALEEIFSDVSKDALPAKIDVLAIPDYPNDAVPHWGLPIFAENKILMKEGSASERNKQDAALLIAKQLTEFWFGNYVTFKWWDELWLQEAVGDFLKYLVVDRVFPEYNIMQQFITEELVNVLIDDGYPSSHPVSKPLDDPYEIEQYFDNIERSKGAAILRMAVNEIGEKKFLEALKGYLKENSWGTGDYISFVKQFGNIGPWAAKDFFDRWIQQPNYPLLYINLIQTGQQFSIYVKQDRHLNSKYSIFSGDLLYPSEYDFTWYVPLTCGFGFTENGIHQVHEETFYISTKESTNPISLKKQFNWVQCDRQFSGYYVTSYSNANWRALASELRSDKQNFDPEDRSSLIHHAFIEGYTDRSTYTVVVDILSYLENETDYLPWKTVYLHVDFLAKVLDYNKAFLTISNFFIFELKKLERDNLWEPTGVHIQELLSETILELSCRLQDTYCINKVAELWPKALNKDPVNNSTNNTIPAYVRSIVYNYHFQNTYDVKDWTFFFRLYDTENDILEEERYLKALTYTRLPWLLSLLIESVERINSLDIFDGLKYISKQPVGREIAWGFLRSNYKNLVNKYGKDDPRLGQLVLDISSSFEDEFMFIQIIQFNQNTEIGATLNARFKALEIASTNFLWLIDNETELFKAFAVAGGTKHLKPETTKALSADEMYLKLKEIYKNFQQQSKSKSI